MPLLITLHAISDHNLNPGGLGYHLHRSYFKYTIKVLLADEDHLIPIDQGIIDSSFLHYYYGLYDRPSMVRLLMGSDRAKYLPGLFYKPKGIPQ